jgi:hypothetical protein
VFERKGKVWEKEEKETRVPCCFLFFVFGFVGCDRRRKRKGKRSVTLIFGDLEEKEKTDGRLG